MSDAYIEIVFDGPPAHESGRFVEVENPEGASIRVGEWIEREDGFWVLRILRRPVRRDHASEAARVLIDGRVAVSKAKAHAQVGARERADDYGKKATGCWAQAQVHATLALVEQQRLANLITLRQADSDVLRDGEWHEVEAAIREGLGLS
ncbi:hypothetical protein MN032_17680 [Agromyces atrinae]|uniref:hypothetical protein n=1 Tax=Agromyces atrinae TaxID=592376 RepID=UPI001F591F6C|nr:hypothetical protein [Agromyces atrinae]MCI2959519.1 hypothetical protein [Agromyces atrinae]